MNYKELKHEISMKLVEFFRQHGKNPATLLLGRNEYGILTQALPEEASGDLDIEQGSDKSTINLWSMNVCMKNVDSCIIMEKKATTIDDFFDSSSYEFKRYRMKIEISIPIKFRTQFSSFLNKQSDFNVGVKLVVVRDKIHSTENKVWFQISVAGRGEKIVKAWVDYILEVEKVLKEQGNE